MSASPAGAETVEPLELREDPVFGLAVFYLASFFSLVTLLLCWMAGSGPLCLLVLALPLAAGLWARWRRRRMFRFFGDHMVAVTWFSQQVVPYDGATAELRLRDISCARSPALNAYQPVLLLRRDGRIAAAVPRGRYPREDILRAAEVLRKGGVPVQRRG